MLDLVAGIHAARRVTEEQFVSDAATRPEARRPARGRSIRRMWFLRRSPRTGREQRTAGPAGRVDAW
jgi:hypothetical protein